MADKKILIVEDEGIIALELQARLIKLGYDVPVVVDTGAKAIEQTEVLRPDLVLMDIALKGDMDGVEAANTIRRRYMIPVVFLTANMDEHTFQRAKLSGPFGYILKPFQARELYTTIEIALYKSQTEKEVQHYREQLEEAHATLNEYVRIVDENVLTSSTDTFGVITYVSAAFCRISGYSAEEMIGKPHNIVRHPDNPKELYAEMWRIIKAGGTWRGEMRNIRRDGSEYWAESTISPNVDKAGNIIGYTAVRQDITDKKIIEQISITDCLTGLFNRRHFNNILPQELRRCKRERKSLLFLMFDVDHFKLYNDTYGHPKGDDALAFIGSSLRHYLKRAGDYGFRLGGEEFGAVFGSIDPGYAMELAEEYRQRVEEGRIVHEKNEVSPFLTISIGGVVVTHDSDETVEGIIKKADEALYQAKTLGRNRVHLVR